MHCGDSNKQPMLLLHGYLSASIFFFKLLKELAENYNIYCLDLLGMGRSSRPEFTAKGSDESEMFFVNPLEKCREFLKLEKFILAGHSFGGYIAGCYAEAFPQYVDKLLMISAVGFGKPPAG